MNSACALKLSQLTKVYRRSHLGRVSTWRGVADVSLEVPAGQVFGLLGPNGSGKTTIIKLILGLLFPTTGTAEVFGTFAREKAARAQLGYLPEVPYFYKYLTPLEVLQFYGRLSLLPEAQLSGRIAEVLEIVRMSRHVNRPMREFSKGMLQRIGLAQAMLHNPKILILDEPVTGLDPVGLREMRELLVRLNSEGKTIFFSSHSISEVEKFCHRVGILVEGKLERVVSQEEWKAHPGQLEEIFIQTVTAASHEAG